MIRVEVLAVLLGEGVAVTRSREHDLGVARASGRVDDAADHEVVRRRCTGDDAVGHREVHHRVGVDVEDEPPGGSKPAADRGHRQAELVRSQVVETVERADRSVEDSIHRQVGQDRPAGSPRRGRGAHAPRRASRRTRRRRRPRSRAPRARQQGGRCRSRGRGQTDAVRVCAPELSRNEPSGHGRGRRRSRRRALPAACTPRPVSQVSGRGQVRFRESWPSRPQTPLSVSTPCA